MARISCLILLLVAVVSSSVPPYLLVGTVGGFLYSLDMETRDIRWRFDTGGSLARSVHLSSPDTPLLDVTGDLIIADPVEGNLYSFGNDRFVAKKYNGSIKEFVMQSPSVNANSVYLGTKESVIYALDPETGELLRTFSHKPHVKIDPAAETPENVLLVPRVNYLLTLNDKHSGQELWNFTHSQLESTDTISPEDEASVFKALLSYVKGYPKTHWMNLFDSPPVYLFVVDDFGSLIRVRLPAEFDPSLVANKGPKPSRFPLLPNPTDSTALATTQQNAVYIGQNADGNLYALALETIPEINYLFNADSLPSSSDLLIGSSVFPERPSVLNPYTEGEEICFYGNFHPVEFPETPISHGNTPVENQSKPLTSPPPKPKPNYQESTGPIETGSWQDFLTTFALAAGLMLMFVLYTAAKAWNSARNKLSTPVKQPRENVKQPRENVDVDEVEEPALPQPQPSSPLLSESSKKRKKKSKHKGAPAIDVDETPSAVDSDQAGSSSAVHTPTPEQVDEVSEQQTGWTKVGKLLISPDILGHGSHGTVVYRGKFEGRDVAIKRLVKEYYELAQREVELLQQSDDHGNVVRYFCQEQHQGFLYIALELCDASLFDVVEGRNNKPEVEDISMEPRTIMLQVMRGIQHLHDLNIVHRDIKPHNILVSRKTKPRRQASPAVTHRVVLSDFGLCKRLEDNRSSFTMSHAKGTVGWTAPELIWDSESTPTPQQVNLRVTKAVDVFSCGCLLYYLLTDGGHPFGNRLEREQNIFNGSFNLSALNKDPVAQDLISLMIAKDPTERPSIKEVLCHPYFWRPEKRLNFLTEASDAFETAARDSAFVLELESHGTEIFGPSWMTNLDQLFFDDLKKYRKYQDNSVRELLRIMRNKKHHYHELSPELKKRVGTLPDGFLHYFEARYPLLFITSYHIVHNSSAHRMAPMFRLFFDEPEKD